jgi:D-sedoheptulose 7-phosphate isomerase
MTNAIENMFQEANSPAQFAKAYLAHLSKTLETLDADAIASFIGLLLDARESESTVFFLGNGGSAATSSHFANDIAVGTRSTRKPFRAISLTDNVAVMTAIANDYSYDDIFLLQLKYQLRNGDVVVGISASGNSPNVLKAIEYANSVGAHTVALTGFDGGRLRQLVKTSLHVQTGKGEYGPVEDAHMILDHLIGGFLMQLCRAEASAGVPAI